MYPHFLKVGLLVVLAGLLIACSGGAEKTTGNEIGRLAGDVSVIGANVTVTDADGDTVIDAVSDESARYEAEVPPDTKLPLTVAVRGGTDLVVGGDAELDLLAVTYGTSSTVNVSLLTTLAARMAECSGPMSRAGLNRSWSLIEDELSMGLGTPVDEMQQPVTASNVAARVLANEAMLEVLRRVRAALAGSGASVPVDEVLTRIACDLEPDGVLNGVGPGADARTTAAFRAAQAAALLEVIAGRLHIAGQNAMPLLDLAIVTMLGTTGVSVSDLVVDGELVEQARAALSLFLLEFGDDELVTFAVLLGGTNPAAVAGDIAAALDAAHQTVLWDIPARVALADSSAISAIQDRMSSQGSTSLPTLSFAASDTRVDNGTAVTLSWVSEDADRCAAAAGWAGDVGLDGTHTTGGLTRTTDYELTCTGLGGTSTANVRVLVTNPDPGPVVTLSAQNQSLEAGDSTTLSWSSTNADQCQASGAWSGARGTAGTEPTGVLNSTQTYTLTCSGSGGSDSASVTVAVDPPPALMPSVSLNSADQLLDSGGSTTLTWSSADASSCSASGGWSGSRSVNGSQAVGPVNAMTTYTLTCSGVGGNAMAMITVNVNGVLSLNWVAPTENVDGSALTDLAGYKIYYGDSSRNYSGSADVNDAGTTSFSATVPSGSYYVAMTAIDVDDNESAYSNEVLKTTD